MQQEKLIISPRLKNRHQVFEGRSDGGRYLASMLTEYPNRPGTMVLAIPSGGVPVGLEIAHTLSLPLDIIITRKIQIPGNTEAGFGAVTMDGKVLINDEILDRLRLSDAEIEKQVHKVRMELARRNTMLRNNRPPANLTGKPVILTDDGLASGFTMLAAIEMVRKGGAADITVAIPTSPFSALQSIADRVDRIVCANMHDYGPFAVAAAYRRWRDLDLEEVVMLLEQAPVSK
ncbi:MAG: phosphoribosyltransferase [Desulforhopalus sp.]